MAVGRPSAITITLGALAAALLTLLVYGVLATGDDTSLDRAAAAGERPAAPGAEIRLDVLDGPGTRSLAALRGQVVVLNFWASWCDPCRDEAPVLERAHRRMQRERWGTVLGATYQDAVADSRRFIREQSLTYPSVRDVGTKLAREYGTKSLPETFVLDAQGRIVAVARGAIDEQFLTDAIERARRT